MKKANIPYERIRKSALASFAIEGLYPNKETLKLADLIRHGKISTDEAISLIVQRNVGNINAR